MHERRYGIVLALIVAGAQLAGSARAQMRVLRTDQLDLIHFGSTRYVVPHAARCFQNAYDFHHEIFGWTPSEKVTMLIHDFYDHCNASASSVPRNNIMAAVAPFSYAFDILSGNEHINWLMNHEMVHILASDMAAGRDRMARKLFFGKVYPTQEQPLSMLWSFLTSPRLYSPGWYHEGVASFTETWMAGGLGRAQSAYDEMAFRTMVLEGKPIYDLVGLESSGTTEEFQVGANNYLYGTRFVSHLVDESGPERMVDWVARKEGTEPYFAAQFEKLYGKKLDASWSEWIRSEGEFQGKNLAKLREHPITQVEPLTSRALGSVSRPAIDRKLGKVYLGISYPGQIAHLAELDLASREMRKLLLLKGAALFWVTSLALDPEAQTLFYITDNNDYRDLNALDLKSGKSRLLQRDARVGDLAFDASDRSLWGVRHYNGISTLVRIPPPYTEWNQIHSFPYGNDIYSLDVSPDGSRLVAALTHVDGTQSLALFDVAKLRAGDATYTVLGEFENTSPADFVFSPDGGFLYGSSYYSGVSNLYRYSFASDEIEPLSNIESGLFRPVPLDDGRLFAMLFTSAGFQPVTLAIAPVEKINSIDFLGAVVAEKYPVLKSWNIGSPAEIDLEQETRYDGELSIAGSLGLASIYPIVEGYKDSASAGLHVDIRDPVGLSTLGITVSYSPDDELLTEERLHALAVYRYFTWQVEASYNRANFYDLFGPTKSGRKGYSLGIEHYNSLILDEPNRRLDVRTRIAGYRDLDTLPGFQNVASPATELTELESALHYKSVRKSLGAVENQAGVELELVGGDQLVSGDHFPYLRLDLSAGTELPLQFSSLWLHSSFGGAFGDRDNAFGNFYLGGFRNNWVDYHEQRRYREAIAFPGFEIDEIVGHKYGKTLLEWNLPPLRFKAGTSAAFVNWVNIALFGGLVVTDFDHSELQREFSTGGIQVDTRFTVRAHMQFTLSLGAAFGRESGGESVDEYMVSLKLRPQ